MKITHMDDATIEPYHRQIFRRLVNLVYAGLFVVVVSTVLGFFGAFHFLLDLFAHFRLVYVALLIAGIVLSVAQKRRKIAITLGVGFVLNMIVIGPMFLGRNVPQLADKTPQKLRVMSINVLRKNEQKQQVIDAILDADPDIVFGIEVDSPWAKAIDGALKERWPHSIVDDRSDNYGVLLYSKMPINKWEIFESPVAYVPTIRAEVQLQDSEIVVYGIHTFPPLSDFNALALKSQLNDVAQRIKKEQKPVVLLGDLNSTPFSFYFRTFLDQCGLVDSERGIGPQSSWPSNFPYLGIPIDHVLTSPKIVTQSRHIGSYNGSDHFPVIADLLVPQ